MSEESHPEEYRTESSEHYYLQVVPETVKLQARRRYSGKGRYYHTWQHIKEMFRGLELVDEALECLPAVILATVFHDIVLDAKRTDNEERSAAFMRGQCRMLNPFWVERAETLILATANGHRLPAGWHRNSDAGYFLDLDLAILAASAERYREYLGQVRLEYRHLTDAEWQQGRAAVVKHFLGLARQGTLFHTDWGRENFQAAAETNLAQELTLYSSQ